MSTIDKMKLTIDVRHEIFPFILKLPWQLSLDEWKNNHVKILNIKAGLSRHVVTFIQIDGHKLAIKEMNGEIAQKEIKNYEILWQRNIPTLFPMGVVIRQNPPLLEKTPFGTQVIENEIGYSITQLAERVLPDSRLYQRGFTKKNRNKIWDAVVKLFIQLHTNGVYWGDASLANLLIQFGKEEIPEMGKRTVLKAILADAETVEFPIKLSNALRRTDIDHFFESIDWFTENLRQAGIINDRISSMEYKNYILEKYDQLMEIEKKEDHFEKLTTLNVKKHLGDFADVHDGDILLKHIEEHKWYLNEHIDQEISLREAAQDWYQHIFIPICDSFRKENLPKLFPGKTAAHLYVEIMEHKYFLSEKMETDVGFVVAMKDYCQKFGEKPSSPSLLRAITNSILRILGKRESQIIEGLQDIDDEDLKKHLPL